MRYALLKIDVEGNSVPLVEGLVRGCRKAESPCFALPLSAARGNIVPDVLTAEGLCGLLLLRQGRAGQGRAGQGRAGQGRAGQGWGGVGSKPAVPRALALLYVST